MSKHKPIEAVIQAPIMVAESFSDKVFCRDNARYLGRTLVVLTVLWALYKIYKNTDKIKALFANANADSYNVQSKCDKCKNPYQISVKHPINVNVSFAEEGKKSEDALAFLVPQSPKREQIPKANNG